MLFFFFITSLGCIESKNNKNVRIKMTSKLIELPVILQKLGMLPLIISSILQAIWKSLMGTFHKKLTWIVYLLMLMCMNNSLSNRFPSYTHHPPLNSMLSRNSNNTCSFYTMEAMPYSIGHRLEECMLKDLSLVNIQGLCVFITAWLDHFHSNLKYIL